MAVNYKRLAELIAENKGKLCHRLEGLLLPSNADEDELSEKIDE